MFAKGTVPLQAEPREGLRESYDPTNLVEGFQNKVSGGWDAVANPTLTGDQIDNTPEHMLCVGSPATAVVETDDTTVPSTESIVRVLRSFLNKRDKDGHFDTENADDIKQLISKLENGQDPLFGGPKSSWPSCLTKGGEEMHLPAEVMSQLPGRRRTPARRGPMDEMRQLVRILVKIIPQSQPYLATTEEGGGNRISEDQIKHYLDRTLGSAPRPDWGLPHGWADFLATLFSWATQRQFTAEQAQECARRLPGRSWEAVEKGLSKYDLRPSTWKLPLQRREHPVNGLYVETEASLEMSRPAGPLDMPRAKKPRTQASIQSQLNDMSELDLWKHMQTLFVYADRKIGTTPEELVDTLKAVQREVKSLVCQRVPDPGDAGQQLAAQMQAAPIYGVQALQQWQPVPQQQQPPQVPHPVQHQVDAGGFVAQPAPSAGADSGGVVHRPVPQRPPAFTPIPPGTLGKTPKTLGEKHAGGADHEAPKSAEDGAAAEHQQQKGPEAQASMGPPPPQLPPQPFQPSVPGIAGLSAANDSDQSETTAEHTLIGNSAPGGGFAYQPAPQQLAVHQPPAGGAAGAGQAEALHPHPGMVASQPYSAAMHGYPASYYPAATMSQKFALPMQFPHGQQLVIGQAADMSSFQVAGQHGVGQQMHGMVGAQPQFVFAIPSGFQYAQQPVMGGAVMSAGQGFPQLMAVNPAGMQHGAGMHHSAGGGTGG